MEQAEGEVDTVNSEPAVAFSGRAVYANVIEGEVFEFLDGPWREHDPRQDGVEEQDEGVGDTSSDTATG